MDAALAAPILHGIRSKSRIAIAALALIVAYLTYAAISFDIAGLAARLRPDNATALLQDFVSYRTTITRDNRSGQTVVAIEGDARDSFPDDHLPPWVTRAGDTTTIDLGRGHIVTYDPAGARYQVPGYGLIDITPRDGKLDLAAPQPLPDWISATDTRVQVKTGQGTFSYSRSKVETARRAAGWEEFFFTLDSKFAFKSWGELVALALWEPRLDPARSNLGAMAQDVWHNHNWHHSDVAWAMGETVLMAFLGTFVAAIVALPLAFLAASNMMPFKPLRFTLRRIFDFIRGTDALIWTLVLVRAFGPGPMTGALAIVMTDIGLFGKTFSEALENIDEKQVEGIRSTGAPAHLRARFGVLPQVLPILASQILYNFESNTRSATVIGAIVGGGIGLLLTQAIQTQKDWEDVAYYLILIVLTVMAMDSLSGLIRRKLIKGDA
jgi:phosphonate transport system permease protein